MFCPKCGTQNPDGARFCLQCGNAFVAPNPASAPPSSGAGKRINPRDYFKAGNSLEDIKLPPKKPIVPDIPVLDPVEPVAQPVAEPVAEPVAQPVAEPVAEPVASP